MTKRRDDGRGAQAPQDPGQPGDGPAQPRAAEIMDFEPGWNGLFKRTPAVQDHDRGQETVPVEMGGQGEDDPLGPAAGERRENKGDGAGGLAEGGTAAHFAPLRGGVASRSPDIGLSPIRRRRGGTLSAQVAASLTAAQTRSTAASSR